MEAEKAAMVARGEAESPGQSRPSRPSKGDVHDIGKNIVGVVLA